MEIDVTQFVANKTDSRILHSLCGTFGRVNSGKMTVLGANVASRPSGRNTFNMASSVISFVKYPLSLDKLPMSKSFLYLNS